MENEFLTASDFRGFYALRQGGLTSLGRALSARIAVNERQRRWAEARFGKESAAVEALAEANALAARRRDIVELEAEKASVPVADIGEEVMGVAGQVTLKGKGVSGYTVAAYDPEGRLAGNGCSGEGGVFVMEIERAVPFRLVVLDRGGRECWADEAQRPFTPAQTLFVTLEICKAGSPCREPPDSRPQPGTFPMPDLVGMKEEEAKKTIRQAKLKLGRRDTLVQRDRAGLVVSHVPAKDDQVTKGTAVDIVVAVAEGSGSVEVPDLKGRTIDESRRRLEGAGLTLGKISSVTRPRPVGVEEQAPAAGKKVSRGSAVAITVGVAKDLDLDRQTIADLFDLQETRAAAGIAGSEVLTRLATSGVRTLQELRRAASMSDEALGRLVGIVDAKRLEAIRAGLSRSLRLIDRAG